MTTQEIAAQLVALCRAGRNIEAVDALLSDNVVSVEARGDETMPAEMTGRDTIRGKNEWWVNNHKIHHSSVRGPYPNGDRFAVIFNFDVTPVSGPMAGQRMRMEEVALYTVSDGKITREEFFYDMSGASVDAPPAKSVRKAAKTKTKAKPKGAAKETAVKAKAKAKAKTTAKTKAPVKAKAQTKAKAKTRTSRRAGGRARA